MAANQRGLGHPGNWPSKKTFGDFLEKHNWKSCLFGGENVALKSEQRDVALVAANQGGLAHPGNWPGKKNLRSWNNFFGKV